jgi:hypothetical protein
MMGDRPSPIEQLTIISNNFFLQPFTGKVKKSIQYFLKSVKRGEEGQKFKSLHER